MKPIPFKVLKLDAQGTPQEWISRQDAITAHAKGLVKWQLGDENFCMFRGGTNRVSGSQSQLTTAPIIAVTGFSNRRRRTACLTNEWLFARDLFSCAYCGKEYHPKILTRDHILPRSRGGHDTWMNVITACQGCNNYKDDKTPQEADMPLRYQPYAPSMAEQLVFERQETCLPVQAEYLKNFVAENARSQELINSIIKRHQG